MRTEEWMKYLEIDEADLMETEALLWEMDEPYPMEAEALRRKENETQPEERKTLQPRADKKRAWCPASAQSKGAGRERKRLPKRKWLVLLAACLLLAGLGIGAIARESVQNGWLSSYFQVSDEASQTLLARMDAGAGAVASDGGYTLEVTEAVSDGKEVYALLTLTGPEGEALDADSYSLAVETYFWKDGAGGGKSMTGSGGGYTEEIDRPAQNQIRFMTSWQFDRMEKKKLLLEVREISAVSEGELFTVAKGNWALMLEIPQGEARRIRQWTKVENSGETYYVYLLEITAVGVHISAVKAVPFSALLKTAGYFLGREKMIPGAWGKESFFELPVTVIYEDGSREVLTEAASGGSSRGTAQFCEKTVHYPENRLHAPAKIQEVRLGDATLEMRGRCSG